MIQSGGILPDLLAAIPQIILLTIEEALKRGVKEAVTLAKNDAWELAKKKTEHFVHKGINEFNKKFTLSKGLEITLTKIKIKKYYKSNLSL